MVKVLLDVGGRKVLTSKSTLCKYENTLFSGLFSGRFAVTTESDGSIFIDRSPKVIFRANIRILYSLAKVFPKCSTLTQYSTICAMGRSSSPRTRRSDSRYDRRP